MILAKWNNEWVAASRLQAKSSGCSLAVRNSVGARFTQYGFQEYNYKTFWHKNFPSTEGITFYPEIYYHGCRVWPQAWFTESAEPILKCHATPDNLDDLDSDYFREITRRMNAQFPSEVMMADGWYQIERGVFEKFVHVDNLEKVDGPPPEGGSESMMLRRNADQKMYLHSRLRMLRAMNDTARNEKRCGWVARSVG